MSELKLLNCPFCGGNVTAYADRYEKVMIECDNCKMYFGVQLEIGCELKDGWKATLNSKEDAIKRWNTRTPMDNIVEKLEERRIEYELSSENAPDTVSSTYRKGVMRGYEYSRDLVKQEINNGLE